LPPSQLFKHWEKQGVLLLNTSFTCEIGSPGSHKHIWQSFTLELLQFINKKNKEITWFLWGNHALEASSKFEIKNKLITQHPMMCFAGENRNNDFLFGTVNCFEPFIDSIDWTGFQLKKGLKTSSKLF
jgi:uracil-DNA glycosylase